MKSRPFSLLFSLLFFFFFTIIWFPYMFPKDFLLLTFTHPTPWANRTHCFLSSPVLSCLWAIVYVPPTPNLTTRLWTLRSFEIQVRLSLLHKGFLISKLKVTFFFEIPKLFICAVRYSRRVWVSRRWAQGGAYISLIAMFLVPKQVPST